MADSLYSRRTLFIRIGFTADHMGLETVQLDNRTRVIYNAHPNTPSYVGECIKHAAAHYGKIIIPFTVHISGKSLDYASHFLITNKNGNYLFGDIAGSGFNWTRETIDDTQYANTDYSTPHLYAEPKAGCWVALRNCVHGEKLNLDGWLSDKWENGRQLPLEPVIKKSAAPFMNVYAPEGGLK